MIKHVLHKTSKPPAIELVKAMISMHGNVTQHVRETVSWVEADTRDLEKERSDISGIRRGQDTEDDARDHLEHSNKRAPSPSQINNNFGTKITMIAHVLLHQMLQKTSP